MMRLSQLEATFVGNLCYTDSRESFRHLPTKDGAQGLLLICPKCQNHSVLIWFLNPCNAAPVPAEAKPGPGRWTFSGDGIETLSLTPSVDLSKIDNEHPESPCRCYWHGFVTNGEAS